jgi:hypothetical protein
MHLDKFKKKINLQLTPDEIKFKNSFLIRILKFR